MQITSFETLSGLERSITISIDHKDVNQNIQSRINKLSQSMRMDGFRKGKVPTSHIKKRFFASIKAEVLNEQIGQALDLAMQQKELRPVTQPKVELIAQELDADITFKAEFEIFPSVPEFDVAQYTLEKPVVTIGEAELEEQLETWKAYTQEWLETTDEVVSAEHRVGLKFEAQDASQAVAKLLDSSPRQIQLGDNKFYGMLENAKDDMTSLLLDKKIGDVVHTELHFPEDYKNETLQGQKVKVALTIETILASDNSSLTDEKVQKLGFAETVAELKDRIKENLEQQVEQVVEEDMKQQLFKKLTNDNDFPLPKTMLETEIAGSKAQNKKLSDVEHEEAAKKSVMLGILVGDYVNQHKIEPDQQRVLDLVKQIAMQNQNPQEFSKEIMGNKGVMQRIMAQALENQAVEHMLSRVKTNEVPMSFAELTHKDSADK